MIFIFNLDLTLFKFEKNLKIFEDIFNHNQKIGFIKKIIPNQCG